MNHDRKSEGIRPIKAVVFALRVVAFRKIEVPSIHPSPLRETRYGKADVDGRTRNIFEALANLTPRAHDEHPRIHLEFARRGASVGQKERKKEKEKSNRSRATILIPDNWKSFPNLEKSVDPLLSPTPQKQAQLAHGVRNACLIPTSGVSRLIFSSSSIIFLPTPSALFPSSYLVPDPQFSYVRTFPPHGSSRELARFPVCFRRIVSRPRTSAVGVGTSFNLRDAT